MCSLSPHRFLLNLSTLLFFAAVSLSLPNFLSAQSLKITSNPAGATVELDGVPTGTTPLEKTFPGGYFHRTKTALGQRLEHPMVARISLPGFVTHEIPLTEGPMDWMDLHGRHHGQYWLFKSDHFHVDLATIAGTFTGRFLQTPQSDRLPSNQNSLSKNSFAAPSPRSSACALWKVPGRASSSQTPASSPQMPTSLAAIPISSLCFLTACNCRPTSFTSTPISISPS